MITLLFKYSEVETEAEWHLNKFSPAGSAWKLQIIQDYKKTINDVSG